MGTPSENTPDVSVTDLLRALRAALRSSYGRAVASYVLVVGPVLGLTVVLMAAMDPGWLSGAEATSPAEPTDRLFDFFTWLGFTLAEGLVVARAVAPDTSVKDGLVRASARIGPLLVCSFAVGIAFGLGLLLLVVPGFVLWSMFSLSSTVIVAENLGANAALQRSVDLTRGARLAAFCAYAVVWLMGLLVLAVLAVLLGIVVVFVPSIPDETGTIVLLVVVTGWLGAVHPASLLIGPTLYRLRVPAKVDGEGLRSVFT